MQTDETCMGKNNQIILSSLSNQPSRSGLRYNARQLQPVTFRFPVPGVQISMILLDCFMQNYFSFVDVAFSAVGHNHMAGCSHTGM